jgi:P-type Ca2+ transporter type 2C
MAFTTLVLAQPFNCFNARSDRRSAFHDLFTDRWLLAAIALSLCFRLQSCSPVPQ